MVDPYEAELAEQAASGGSGSTLGGGFNFSGSSGSSNISTSSDDGGDSYVPGQGISLTKATRQEYVPGQGFTFSMPSASDAARQQRLSGMGDYRNSEAYERYKTETGRSLQNPYGNTGLFSGIFGADRVNYNMDPAQAQNILDIGFDRYMNFDQQPEYAQKRGFGKLFGSPEGEMTAQGEIREQIQPMSTSDMAARLVGAAGGLGAPLAMLPGRNVGYAPMGSSSYNPELDPQVNPDLKSGPFSLLTGGVNIPEAFGRAKDFITSKLSPAEELAAQTQTQARGPELSELSQTVSGGRFEDESARPQTPTPRQESLTFDGSIENSLRQSQNKDNPFIEQGLVNPRKVSTVGLDQINPLTVDFLDDINLGQLADIVEKARSGDLLSTQTPFGQLSFEPEFQGSRPVGGMIRLKGQF